MYFMIVNLTAVKNSFEMHYRQNAQLQDCGADRTLSTSFKLYLKQVFFKSCIT